MGIVIHDTGVWLPRTNTWIYNQIMALDETWEAWVIANRTENLDEFPFDNLFSLRDRYGKNRWFLEMLIRRSGLFAHAPSISKFCSSLSPDLLHSHFGTTGWRNLKLARKLGVAHIVTFYGFDVTRIPRHKLWRKRYSQLFDQVDLILCEGPHMAEEIIRLGCPKSKVNVHRLGVHLSKLPFSLRTTTAETVNYLMAGSFREKKGLTDGLLALAKLGNSRPNHDWRLTIVGGPGNNSEGESIARELQNIATQYGVSDRVSYTGFLSHDQLIQQGMNHDVFLCPSVTAADGDTEGGAPVVMIEMAALGLPVIASHHCDMPYTLGERNRTLLVAERDVEALTRSLELLVDNRDTWSELSSENRAHIEQSFDHDKQGKQLSRLYSEVSKG